MSKEKPYKEPVRLNRKVITFLFCVLISIFFWLMMSLSKEYDITVSYPVEYVNAPKDRVISNDLPSEINIEIHAKGFYLLANKFKKAQTVYIDLKTSHPTGIKNYYFLLTNARLSKVMEQFSSRIRLLRISPDTIYLNYNKKVTKHVPVKANIALTVDNAYQLADSIRLVPDHIDVSGSSDMVSKIDYVETVPVTIKDLDVSKAFTLDLIKGPENSSVELSETQVRALITVKKFTEASVELPVEAINLPAGYSLKAFPDKVTVKYNVAYDNYQNINTSQFRAVIDYRKAEPGSNKLKITLEKYPQGIRAIKLNPEKAEYIIKK